MTLAAVSDDLNSSRSEFTAEMVARVFRPAMERPPLSVRQRLRHALIDWAAVTVAGSTEEVSRIARCVEVQDGGRPMASLVGCAEQVPAAGAAFVNAISGHSQDYDSSNLWSLGHTMTPVIAAALAMGEELGSTGRDLQLAVLRGTEVASVMGLATANLRKSRGLHLTGFTGVFGATASCVSLLGLDREAMLQSMGLAATQAAGLRSVFGTMGKSLNAGLPARNGVIAAKLVASGFTGPHEAVTGPSGYARAYAIDFSAERPFDVMGEGFGIESTVFKFHSNCHGLHASMEALAQLMSEHCLRAEMIREVVLTVPLGLLSLCPFNDPATESEAQFSVPYAMALVLAGAPTGPVGFTREKLVDPLLGSLRRRITVHAQPANVAVDGPSEVVVTLRDGRRLGVRTDGLRPCSDSRLSTELVRLEAKFMDLVEPILGCHQARSLRMAIDGLESLRSVRELSELMRRS
ncbi:MAG: MmgE/PrpD family protein [Gammaproteobacteria bacterium]